jgi:hypothetical protein
MRRALGGIETLTLTTVGLAAVCALIGFLIGHFAGDASVAHSVGWGMCIGGALTGFAAGQSGSTSRMAVEGRTGFFATFWGSNSPLSQSPLWLVLASLLVFAGGIALFVVAG